MFLMFATFCCFGTTYYLFTPSRWVSRPGLSLINLELPSLVTSFPSSQSGLPQMHQPNPQVQPGEKFLSYLPHSGFHNQRIALENALVLARSLNQTLLVPPVRFGRRTIPYHTSTVLQRIADADYITYLCQLSDNTTNRNDTPAVRGALLDFLEPPEHYMLKKKRKPVIYTYLPWPNLT
ncbi:hypothetical protein BDM02DRAFT_1688632 [Thelephora ganbajun]|uniref:Uncharacterized protein n=1 Tax=Thelephora ganbajun TaxID=370292 RepID=A0ACB6ZKT3_THEGA|nr:hypothetical protein BDM02DRAFT_1688632 [Thelephora ganbajun]